MRYLATITILYLCVVCNHSAAAQNYASTFNKLNGTAQQSSASDLEPERKKKATSKSLLKIRSKVFTVNLVRFNKRIRAKHDREKKALAKYEFRLKKKQARKDARKKDFKVKIKRRGASVKQKRYLGN